MLFIYIVIFVLFICLILFFVFNKFITKGEITKAYTRLTLAIVLISLFSTILALISLQMNYSLLEDTREAMQATAKGIPPINPEIELILINKDYNYLDSSLTEISHDQNWSFYPNVKYISFIVRNKGQSLTGNVNFYLKDIQNQFYVSHAYTELTPFDYDYLDFGLKYSGCRKGQGKEDYFDLKDSCNPSNIKEGLNEWILKIDCPLCEKQTMCYSFNICIYNVSQQQEYCEREFSNQIGKLKYYDCPENSFFN